MKNRDYGTRAGTGAYEGQFWNGKQWVGEPTEAALEARKSQPWTAANVQQSPEEVIAKRLTGVIYAVLAVLCGVVAIALPPLFGTAGTLAALIGLFGAFVLTIMAMMRA